MRIRRATATSQNPARRNELCWASACAAGARGRTCKFFMEPHSWHRQPSLSSTRFRTIVYSSESSLIRGRFWRTRLELAKSLIVKPTKAIRPHWRPQENPRRSSPGNNHETVGSQHQASRFESLLDHWQLTLVDLEVDD